MKRKNKNKPGQLPVPDDQTASMSMEDAVLPGEEIQPLAVLRLHWKKIFFVAAGVVLLVWGVAVIGDSLVGRGGNWVTDQASYVRQDVTLDAQVTFVREEVPLSSSGDGVVFMLTQPGHRVGAQQAYALVCGSRSDAENLSRQEMLEQRLSWMQDAEEAKTYQALNAEQLGKQVNTCFSGFLQALESGDCTALPEQQEEFLHRATTLEAALGRPVEYAQEIAAVQQQLNSLRSQTNPDTCTKLTTERSGDYYPVTDGLEQVLTPQALEQIDTPEALAALLAQAPVAAPNAKGKLITSFRWYMTAVLPGGQAPQLEEGGTYRVRFPQESARTFTMRAEKIRRMGDESLVVFSCDEKDDTLQCLRSAKAEIVLDTVEGLKVPAAALRFLEKGEGVAKRTSRVVYIVRAGQLQPREVELLHWDAEMAVVAWGNQSEAVSVSGDRITITGKIQAIDQQSETKLLLIGQDMVLTAENLNVTPAIEGGPTTAVTAKRKLFVETIITGKNLKTEQRGDSLILTGSNIVYREQRGTGLKIHDTVLVEGKVQDAA